MEQAAAALGTAARLAGTLAERHVVISAGGELRRRSMTLSGHMAIEAIDLLVTDRRPSEAWMAEIRARGSR